MKTRFGLSDVVLLGLIVVVVIVCLSLRAGAQEEDFEMKYLKAEKARIEAQNDANFQKINVILYKYETTNSEILELKRSMNELKKQWDTINGKIKEVENEGKKKAEVKGKDDRGTEETPQPATGQVEEPKNE